MREQEIKDKLRVAAKSITPDILDGLFDECQEQPREKVITLPKQSHRNRIPRVLGLAACVALFLAVAFVSVGLFNRNETTAHTTICVDVNPSIEILLDQDDVVLEVVPLNDDATALIKDTNFTENTWDKALDTLITLLLRDGYLNENENSILISVEHGDPQKAKNLQQQLSTEVTTAFEQASFNGSVICQTVTKTDDLVSLADRYGISFGKAALIKTMISENNTHTFEDLVSLSVNELKLITETEQLPLNSAQTIGAASNKSFIEGDTAIKIATQTAQITETSDISCELTCKNGVMLYKVSFRANEDAYVYEINAKDGSVIGSQIENGAQNTDIDTDISDTDSETDTSTDTDSESDTSTDTDISDTDSETNTSTDTDISNTDSETDTSTDTDISDIDSEADTSTDTDISDTDSEADTSTDTDISDIDSETDTSTDTDISDTDSETDTNTDTSDATTDTEDFPVTEAEAKAIAFRHAQVNEYLIWDQQCNLNADNGVYTIVFYAFTYEYTYQIDANTGAILEENKDYIIPRW